MGKVDMNKVAVEPTSYEINFMSLLRRVALRWKLMLICAVLLGTLGGVRNYMSQKAAITAKESEIASAEVAASGTEYKNISASIENAIADEMNYLSQSPVNDLINSAYQATAVVCIEVPASGEEENSSPAKNTLSSIKESLQAIIYSGIDYTPLLQDLDIKNEKYIYELIDLGPSRENTHNNEYILSETSDNTNSFVINCHFSSEEKAEKMLQYILDHLFDREDELKAIFGDFTHKSFVAGVRPITSYPSDWMTTHVNTLYSLVTSQTTYSQISPNVEKYLPLNEKAMQDSLVISKKSVLRSALIYAFAGLFGSLFFISLYLVMKRSILDGEDAARQYSYTTLAALPTTKWKNKDLKGIDYTLANLGKARKNVDDTYNIAIETIEASAADARTIAVIGNIDKASADDIAEKLQSLDKNRVYHSYQSLDTSIEERHDLMNCDAAVILIEPETSTADSIYQLNRLTAERNVDIIGAITL